MSDNIYKFDRKHSSVRVSKKENKRKKWLRIGALLAAVLMLGSFCVSLIVYMFC